MWLALSLCLLAAAKKVDFKVEEFDSAVQDMLFCGPEEDVILVLTRKHSVYRSENSGMSWRHLEEILMREGRAHAGDPRSIGEVVSFQISSADKRLIVMLGSRGINWFSDDCGVKIWALNHGKPIYAFQFHPVQREWGLAASWTICDDLESDTCELYKELYVTKDLGLTWTLVTPYVVDFSWAKFGLSPVISASLPDDRIYVLYIPDASGHQSVEEWTHRGHFVKSDDYFQTTTTLVKRANVFKVLEKFIVVGQMDADEYREVQLLVSNERNIEQFHPAELPVKHVTDRGFTILDFGEGALFLHVKPLTEAVEFGHVYVSDSSGTRFSVSLLRNVRGPQGLCDFAKVQGLEGIFIANVAAHADPSANSQQSPTKRSPRLAESFHKTVISFDKGNIWTPLQPPKLDSLGEEIECAESPCALHLYSLSSDTYAPAYSSPTALGLVLGTGNVGGYLNTRTDQVNTYLSRDGGLTWMEVKKGSYVYEIGDHGSLIVMASDSVATDAVIYSWDEGLTWEELKFTDEPVEVENIINEPGATSLRFVVLASLEGKGIAVGLDFSSLGKPQCREPDLPGQTTSDYEWWSPNDGRTESKCLMGRTIAYVRRRRDAQCVNGEQFERSTHQESCPCTESDFECDVGYIRKGSGPCNPIPDFEYSLDRCLPGEEFYDITSGYRRIAGDTCAGGVESKYVSGKAPCKSSVLRSMGRSLLLLLFVVAVLAMMCRQAAVLSYLSSFFDFSRTAKYSKNFSSVPDSPDEESS